MSNPTIVAAPVVSDEIQKLQAELELLRMQNEALKKGKRREPKGTLLGEGLSAQISEKGGISVYGLSRFPVTLYKDQWLALLPVASGILAFIKANEEKLQSKPPKAETKTA
jgi:hypothetical protein